jgi:hypothetical protein
MTDTADLNLLLRARLQEFLADDLQRRMERPVGAPVYAYWWKHGDPGTAIDADLEAIGAYTRADGDRLRDTLRKLPNQYRKSEKDRDKPLAQIIAADAAKSQRVSDKTLKRHFWAVQVLRVPHRDRSFAA